jgi:type 1 fimbria pilin
MSGLFGGSSGKADVGNFNIPAFASSGGITPQQNELGQYTFGEGLVGQGNMFGSEGLGDSTMATQGAEGVKNTEAQTMAGMSDANQGAQYDLYKNDVSALEQGVSNELNIQNANTAAASSSLNNLAKLVGFGTGAAGAGTAPSTA